MRLAQFLLLFHLLEFTNAASQEAPPSETKANVASFPLPILEQDNFEIENHAVPIDRAKLPQTRRHSEVRTVPRFSSVKMHSNQSLKKNRRKRLERIRNVTIPKSSNHSEASSDRQPFIMNPVEHHEELTENQERQARQQPAGPPSSGWENFEVNPTYFLNYTYLTWLGYNNDTPLASEEEQKIYGPCSTYMGVEGGGGLIGQCLAGEMCVDVNTKEPYPCEGGVVQQQCVDCTDPTKKVGDVCTRGCIPPDPSTCAPPTDMDGVCTDAKPDGNYTEEATTARTPMIYYGGRLGLNAPCSAYGDKIHTIQMSSQKFDEKADNLRHEDHTPVMFGSEICNWRKAHLECIPNSPRRSTTPNPNLSPSQTEIDQYTTPSGTCKCMLALGQKPAILKEEVDDPNNPDGYIELCYIPANRGYHSNCDHQIFPPHGIIEGVRSSGAFVTILSRPAAKYCVPNSECRIGYKYTGLRCMCKAHTKWNAVDGTCDKGVKFEWKKENSLILLLVTYFLSVHNYL